MSFHAIFKMSGQSGANDGEWHPTIQVNGSTVGGPVFCAEQNGETGNSSPILGKFSNTSTNALTITINGRQMFSADQSLRLNDPSLGNTTWIEVKEVKR